VDGESERGRQPHGKPPQFSSSARDEVHGRREGHFVHGLTCAAQADLLSMAVEKFLLGDLQNVVWARDHGSHPGQFAPAARPSAVSLGLYLPCALTVDPPAPADVAVCGAVLPHPLAVGAISMVVS